MKNKNIGMFFKNKKGAGFFEYALLALVAVALMALVYTLFSDRINDIFDGQVKDVKITPVPAKTA
jgi:Flp pilus assembly pilin Flp